MTTKEPESLLLFLDKKTLLPQFYLKKCYDSSDFDKRNNHQQLSQHRFTWPCLIFLKTAERIACIKYLNEEKDILDNLHTRVILDSRA